MNWYLEFLTSLVPTIPSNLQKVDENHLKKHDEEKKSRSEPEKTVLNSGPEKADSDPVSKSPESKRKRKEYEIPGSEPVNPESGVETYRLPDPGSNSTPDPSTPFQVAQEVEEKKKCYKIKDLSLI